MKRYLLAPALLLASCGISPSAPSAEDIQNNMRNGGTFPSGMTFERVTMVTCDPVRDGRYICSFRAQGAYSDGMTFARDYERCVIRTGSRWTIENRNQCL